MGYYTTFTLDFSGGVSDHLKQSMSAVTVGRYNISVEKLHYGLCDTMKWYDHDDDMKALSADWPNVLFELTGDGEESDDHWRAWYRNGKSVKVKGVVVFEEPDLDKILPLDIEREARIKQQRVKELESQMKVIKQQIAALDTNSRRV